jgi:transposase
MGTRRRRQRQQQIWVAQQEIAKGPAHPLYARVNELLEEKKFDEFAEKECAKFYADNIGRPSVAPGIYFRLLLVGYFEGIDSERGIAWQNAPLFTIHGHRLTLGGVICDRRRCASNARLKRKDSRPISGHTLWQK